MPPHPSYNLEKSPIDALDYGGLQLDTRAKENRDVCLDDSKPQGFLDDDFDNSKNYLNEKQAHAGVTSREFLSPGSSHSTEGTYEPGISPLTPGDPDPKQYDESLVSPLPPSPSPKRRICGFQSRHFWELLALALMIVITAAIVGGVVGGLKMHRGTPSSHASPFAQVSNNTDTNTTQSFVPLQESDVQVGSELCVVAYDEGPGESLQARQAFRLYFQSVHGNIKESTSYHLEPWSSALPIFTDAVNNTGLATVTYLNQWLSQVGAIFYVGDNGLLQEKRKIYNDTGLWEPGTLNNYDVAAVRNITVPAGSNDPANDWDSYRMAAAYSKNFHSGPGTRLFYHSQQLNGSSYVQELIWYQGNDTWSYGTRLHTPWPNSHLAATIDESTKILRLFFSSGNNTLQEMWMSLTDPNGEYRNGVTLNNLLEHDNADIAALSINGTAYIYHYAFSNQTSEAGIHELTITGTPGSVNNQEAYNLSSPFVVSPQLTINKEESFYQPIAVSNTAVPGLDPAVYVFFADKVSGDPETTATGYAELAEISRSFSNSTWPSAGRLVIDLGDANADPES